VYFGLVTSDNWNSSILRFDKTCGLGASVEFCPPPDLYDPNWILVKKWHGGLKRYYTYGWNKQWRAGQSPGKWIFIRDTRSNRQLEVACAA